MNTALRSVFCVKFFCVKFVELAAIDPGSRIGGCPKRFIEATRRGGGCGVRAAWWREETGAALVALQARVDSGSPSALTPFGEMRALSAEGGVLTVAGIYDG